MKSIRYWLLKFFLHMYIGGFTAPIAFGAIELYEYSDAHSQWRVLKLPCVAIMLVWGFGFPLLTNKTAYYMAFENKPFWDAVKSSFYSLRLSLYSLRLSLVFLPLVGRWFAPKPDDRDDDPTA